jgi:hypothetical protein
LIRFGEDHLDCFFLNEHEYYYSILEAKEGLLQPAADLREILRFTAHGNAAITQTNRCSPTLERRMRDEDADHQYLPSAVKN